MFFHSKHTTDFLLCTRPLPLLPTSSTPPPLPLLPTPSTSPLPEQTFSGQSTSERNKERTSRNQGGVDGRGPSGRPHGRWRRRRPRHWRSPGTAQQKPFSHGQTAQQVLSIGFVVPLGEPSLTWRGRRSASLITQAPEVRFECPAFSSEPWRSGCCFGCCLRCRCCCLRRCRCCCPFLSLTRCFGYQQQQPQQQHGDVDGQLGRRF